MKKENIEIVIYGANQICASCVNAPSSKDTFEWLDAALTRKFPNQPFQISYVDIFEEQQEELHREFCQQIMDEDLFYPVVVMEKEIVGEGIIQLKKVVQAMEQYGYQSVDQ